MPQDIINKAEAEEIVEKTVPSNDDLCKSIDKEIKRIDKVEANPAATYRGERILEDAKDILRDEKMIVLEKNPGEEVQRLIKDGYYLSLDLANDERFSSLFENWSDILTSVARSGEWSDITRAVGTIASDLRNTESFIALLNELQSTIKLLLAQKVDQVTSAAESAAKKVAGGVSTATETASNAGLIAGKSKEKADDVAGDAKGKVESMADSAREFAHSKLDVGSGSSDPLSEEKYEDELEKERRELYHQLTDTLAALSNNPTWKMLLSKSKSAAQTIKTEAVEPSADLLATIADNAHAKDLVDDFQRALQALAGDFDVAPLFSHTRAVIRFVLDDSTYFDLLNQCQEQLTAVAENPELLEDTYTKDNLRSLGAKLQAKIEALVNHPDLLAARTESLKLKKALMNDPAAAKLVADTRKLIRHLHSVRSGHILDPALITEMRGLIVPLLLEHLKDVPLPSVHDVADTPLGKYEYNLDHIRVCAKELVPDNIHVKFEYDLDAHPTSLTATKQRLRVVLRATDIQLHLKDVEWNYERLSTPHLKDDGKLELQTEGRGITVLLAMEVNRLDETHENLLGQKEHNKNVLKVLQSKAWVDRWSVKFSDSKHDTLYAMLSNMFSGSIKKHVEEMLVNKMGTFADTFNHKIYTLYNEAIIKQEELQGWAESKGRQVANANLDIKGKIAASAPAMAAKDFARDKAMEAVRYGVDHAPEIGQAINEYGTKAMQKAGELAGKASEKVGEAADKAGELADKASEKAHQAADKAGELADKAGDKAHQAADKAGDLADKASKKADKAADVIDEKAHQAADKVGEKAGEQQQHGHSKIPNNFRDYAPVPAATFVSADPNAPSSTLGEVPNTAKYPISVMQPAATVTTVEKIPKDQPDSSK